MPSPSRASATAARWPPATLPKAPIATVPRATPPASWRNPRRLTPSSWWSSVRRLEKSRSSRSATIPATIDGTNPVWPESGRVAAAMTAMPARTMTTAAPATYRRTARMPPRAASASSTIRMPARSAVLSCVPNRLIARSLSHGGTRSMKAEPIATTGVWRVPSRAAATLPAARPARAARTPPSAARTRSRDAVVESREPDARCGRAGGRRSRAGRARSGPEDGSQLNCPARWRPAPAGRHIR